MSAKKTTKTSTQTKAPAARAKKAPKAGAISPEPAPPAATDPTPAAVPAPEPANATAPRKTKTKAKAEAKSKPPSALDAAARVLDEAGQAMSCKELIAVMAAQGYWTSPQGLTPAQTLYAAIWREIRALGSAARFVKVGPGRFARAGAA